MPVIARGCWQGEILNQEMGGNGFGYDPLFFIPELNKTSAQLDKNLKNTISHRAKAMNELLKKLQFIDF